MRQQLCPVAGCILGLDACSVAQVIKKQLTEGVTQRRVGLVSTGAPPRAHSLILNQEGKEVRASPEGGFCFGCRAGPLVPGCKQGCHAATGHGEGLMCHYNLWCVHTDFHKRIR